MIRKKIAGSVECGVVTDRRRLRILDFLVKQGIPRQIKEKQNNDKSAFYLLRQCLRDGEKALILKGFLDENVKFTPYLHLWKIGSVVKTCGD